MSLWLVIVVMCSVAAVFVVLVGGVFWRGLERDYRRERRKERHQRRHRGKTT